MSAPVTWQNAEDVGSIEALSGLCVIGYVVQVSRGDQAGQYAWKILDIRRSGKSSTEANAKRALSRAWKKWCQQRGLVFARLATPEERRDE